MLEKVVVIGGNRGLGLGFVKEYLLKGCSVVATYRDAAKTEELMALKERYTNTLQLFPLDVRDQTAIQHLPTHMPSAIDVLILNAGVLPCVPGAHPLTDTYDEMKEVMEVNAFAPDNIMRALFPNLQNAHSCAVYLSSTLSHGPGNAKGRYNSYRASKAAGNIIIQNWNVELATVWLAHDSTQTRPCAFSISPGVVQTDMGGSSAPLTVAQSITGILQVIEAVRQHKKTALYLYDGSILQHHPEPLIVAQKREEEAMAAQSLVNYPLSDAAFFNNEPTTNVPVMPQGAEASSYSLQNV